MVNSINEHRPFLMPGVPTQFMRLADAGLDGQHHAFQRGSAAAPARRPIHQEKNRDAPVSEGYGLTETAPSQP